MTSPSQVVIGFDLDLTLVDSRPGIAAAMRALSTRTGVFIDADLVVTRLGPPLDVELANWFPAEDVPAAAETFRTLYPDHAIEDSPALPGAVAAIDAVRAAGGQVVVITAKYRPNALLHLNWLGLAADTVVGWAWGEGKSAAMTDHGVHVYLGDHTSDMAAAVKAGVVPVGVLTGGHQESELVAAGASAVLSDLTEFPLWFNTPGRISVGLGQPGR